MSTFFIACAAFGGSVLIAQLVAGLAGFHHDAPHELHGHGAAQEGLNLFSLRALSGGLAFFALGGLGGLALGWPAALALSLALVCGGGVAVGVAAFTRAALRLEADHTVRIERALGASGTVYLSVPPERSGMGKVHVTVQNRLVELQAVTGGATPLVTGSRVLVVDVVGSDVVEVVAEPLPIDSEVAHAAA